MRTQPSRAHRWLAVAAFTALAVLAASCADDDPGAFAPMPTATSGVTTQASPGGGDPVPPPTPSPSPSPSPSAEPEAGAPGIGDPYYPGLGNGGYDVEHYLVDLTWDDDTGALGGTTTLEATATEDLASFNLDYSGETVSAVSVDDTPAGIERDGFELTITPTSPIAEGSTFTVAVDHDAVPGRAPTFTDLDFGGWYRSGGVAFTLSQPAGNLVWHPVNDHPADKARFTFVITTDDDLAVAANGLLTSEVDNGDGTTTWTYETRDPQAPYLTALAIGDLDLVEAAPLGDIVIRHAADRDLVDNLDRFANLPAMIEAFEERFGPYPFEAYGVLLVDEPLGVALELQTLSIFGTDWFAPGVDLDGVSAHELAHQWFGDHVSVEEWDDIWLNEGFATYAQYLWLEASVPDYDIDADMDTLRLLGDDLDAPPPGDPGPRQLFATSVYYRGALTLHELRREIGDDAFFDALKLQIERYGGGNASTADFIATVEEVSGQDLTDFFDAWLHADELPN